MMTMMIALVFYGQSANDRKIDKVTDDDAVVITLMVFLHSIGFYQPS
jgi:hypothetical protein